MSSFDESITDEFMIESKEHLENIENELLDLEKNTSEVDPNKINEIFRGIHSIKGASGFLGFTKIGELSHVMETLLSMMRSGDILPEPNSIDGLLKGVDCLNTMFDDLSTSNEMDITELHALISTFISNDDDPSQTKAPIVNIQSQDPISQETKSIDFEINESLLSNIPKSHEHLYILEYNLVQLAQENKNPVALLKELEGLGDIIETKCAHTKIDLRVDNLSSPMTAKVLFSSVLDLEMITGVACLKQENITKVSLNPTESPQAPDNKKEPAAAQPAPKKAIKKKPSTSEPSQSEAIRINVQVLDRLMTLAGELVLVRNQCMQAVELDSYTDMGNISQHLDVVTTEMQETIMLTRMQPVGNVFGKLPRIVRDLSKKLDKKIEMKTLGNEVEIDKTILQSMADPLTHLVRNCCDHAIESPADRIAAGKPEEGTVTVEAYHEAGQINIKVTDDGKGLDVTAIRNKAIQNELKTEEELDTMSDKEILSLIMLPGFSTAKVVSDVSGRGVGMDVVKSSIEKLGGEVELTSTHGKGATVHMRLPLTLAIIPSLVVGVNGQRYAIPQVSIEELVSLDHEENAHTIENTNSQEVFRLRDHLLPIVRFNEVLAHNEPFTPETQFKIIEKYHDKKNDNSKPTATIFVVVKVRGHRYGLVVNEVFGTEEIVVKPMHMEMKKHEIYSGATVMGDGKVGLILSIEGIAKHAGVNFAISQEKVDQKDSQQEEKKESLLLFKSGLNEQFALAMPLIRRIERIQVEKIETIGHKEFITIDNVSTFILRLDKVLDVSECLDEKELFLLLPKNAKKPYGILMSRVVDILEIAVTLNQDCYNKAGILGTAIIKDHLTLFADTDSLIKQADPDEGTNLVHHHNQTNPLSEGANHE